MVERVASLPMYDLPELRGVTDAWWSGLVRHFRAAGLDGVPDDLVRPGDGARFWRRPDLLLSQSCGYPLSTVLADRVRVVATPCYRFAGCEGPRYSSAIIVAASDRTISSLADLRGRRCAVNKWDSWSGHHAVRSWDAASQAGIRIRANATISGGHRASIAMVAGGRAAFAAIDCVTFGLLSRHAPAAVAGVRVLTMTDAKPGLPLIAGLQVTDSELARLRDGLHAAMADPALSRLRASLGLTGLADLTLSDYLAMATTAPASAEERLRAPGPVQ